MSEPKLSFFARLALGFRVFAGILGDAGFAAAIQRLPWGGGETVPGAATPEQDALPSALQKANPDSALQLLGLLQRDGRLVDFLQEDVAQYSDADIGAAVRIVHEGCRRVLREHFVIEPVRRETEGARVTLDPGFDASAVRPTGNLVGEPPFTGTLSHRGWRATAVSLPRLARGHDVSILAPAEVEL